MKFFYAFGFVLILVLGYGVGVAWKLKPETKYHHNLYRGETAVLVGPRDGVVWLAYNKDDCYAVNVAMARQDESRLRGCEEAHTAFAVPAGTFVKVTGASVSRKLVTITEGPLTGRSGWVEFQYLRPLQPGEFR